MSRVLENVSKIQRQLMKMIKRQLLRPEYVYDGGLNYRIQCWKRV